MEYRSPKETDGNDVEQAYKLMVEFIESHPEIEGTIWAGACWSCLVKGYINSGISYEKFCKEWEKVRSFYKHWWDE